MSRIFLLFMVAIAAFGVTACGRQTEVQTPLPQEISAVTKPFFAAVRRGDRQAAEKFVAPEFIDKSGTQFATMSKILKDAPPLPSTIYQRGADGPFLIFAARDGKDWISSEMRLARINGNYAIQYWDIKKSSKPPSILAHVQEMKRFVNYGMIALAICAALALAALIWFVRNRTHLVAPTPIDDTRKVASIVRNTDV